MAYLGAALACVAPTAADDSPATFFRGLNLNGPAITIDGHQWEGTGAGDFECNGQAFDNPLVPLRPATDRQRARMIRSSRWGRDFEMALTRVPPGTYQVFVYVWEDNDAETFEITLNGRSVVERYDSRGAGVWEKLGPWRVDVSEGAIRIGARGGAANFSGVEVWAGGGEIPDPPEAGETELIADPTPDQVEFFESKVRPLLVQHCYECHSAESKKVAGNLLLDSRAGLIKGGDSEPPIVPGDPEASLLIMAVRHEDPGLKMPPKSKLAPEEIATLEQWVRMGAPDPRTADTTGTLKKYAINWDAGREFWSFQPIRRPEVPAVRDESWPRNDIDRFILARLEADGRRPVADADRRTLIRRVTYDLTGLPPTPEEAAAFLADDSPDAWPRLVERLLESPQYGERWGRHWLDVVRYADTAGDNSDFPIPQMYRYRNWVIAAFNRDLPYDRFIREQLAGDLLPAADEAQRIEQTIATGYIANARRFGSRVDDYPQHLTIEDTIDNLGRAFLGLTINCARCHDHKFDPISTQDYYGLYGIFHSTRYPWPGIELEQKQRDLVPLVPQAEAEAILAARRARQEELDAEVRRLEQLRDNAPDEARAELEEGVKQSRQAAEQFGRSPLPYEQAYAVADAAQREDVRVQQKGDPTKPGPMVRRRFLTIIGASELPAEVEQSGRLQLADWIADRRNPLTARVMANRIWQHHFGRGIVPTPNDFGRQGKPPTHPELLDALAAEFMTDWSVKRLHRLILLSRTYRLSSRVDPDGAAADPANERLAWYPRRRLDAEALRDTLLALSGRLDPTAGAAHPFPPQSEWKFTQHNPFKAVFDTNRRSVYLMTQRIQRHPYLAIFDGADPSASTALRLASTTPLQALYLLNDPFVHEQAAALAERILGERPDDASRLARACQLLLTRDPTADEAAAAARFLADTRAQLAAADVPPERIEPQAWESLVRALLRTNEFVYVE